MIQTISKYNIQYTLYNILSSFSRHRNARLWLRKNREKGLIISLTLLFILSSFAVYFYLNPKQSEAAWWNDNWVYRKKITFGNTGSEVTSDRKIKIDIDTATMITDGKVQSDCQDIRFTDVNGTLLDHFIDTGVADCNNASTDFYVRFSTIYVGTNTIYMYYANPSATTAQKPDFFAPNETPTLGENLKAYWKFDEVSANSCYGGEDACDVAHTHDATIVGGVTTVGGKFGSATNYPGTSDYQTVPDSSELSPSTGNMTASVWIKSTHDFTGTGWIWSNYGSSTNNQHATTVWSTDKVATQFRDNEGDTAATGTGTGPVINDGEWHHIVSRRTGTTVKLFVDGVNVATGSNGSLGNVNTAGRTKVIGAFALNPSIEEFWGDIDDLRIYRRDLTDGEIEQIFNSGVGSTLDTPLTFPPSSGPTLDSEAAGPGPVAYWKFDEGADNTCDGGEDVCDSTANANDGTITGATWQTEDLCVDGKCLYYDGTDDYIQIADAASLNPTSAITGSMWVRINNPTDSSLYLLAKGDVSTAAGRAYELRMSSTTGKPQLIISDGSSAVVEVTANTAVQANVWTHIAFTWDTSNSKIYINGFEDSSVSSTKASINNDGNPLRIATDINNQATRTVDGFIDEVKVYPYARSESEIKEDYNKGSQVLGRSDDSWLSDGLIGYWKLDEASGDASESSGNDLTLTNYSTTTYTGGNFGHGSEHIPASSQYLATTTDINSVKSVSFWVNPDSTTNYYVDLNGSAYIDSSSGTISATGFTDPTIYVDGVETTTVAADSWQLVTVTTDTAINATDFMVGRISSNYFDGTIDEVRMYNRTLSPSEVSKLYLWVPGPIGYWNFDEGNGTSTVYDRSGNSNNATMYGSMTESDWVPGVYGQALDFDGSNDTLQVANEANFDFERFDPFTFTAWIKHSSNSTHRAIFSKMYNGGSYRGYDFQTEITSGHLKFLFITSWSSWAIETEGTTNLADNTWHHVGLTFDGSSDASGVTFYVDGIKESKSTNKNSLTATALNNYSPYIGSRNNSAFYRRGPVDELRVYNYTRTQQQIIEDMNAGHPAPGSPVGSAIGHWKFDEGYGDTANDSGTGGNDASLAGGDTCPGDSNCPTWTSSGKFGKALDFDGAASPNGDFVDTGEDALFDFGDNPFAISMWIKRDGTGRRNPIGNTDGSSDGWYMQFRTDDTLDFRNNDGGGNNDSFISSDAITDTIWHHYVCQFTSETDIECYIDGVRMEGTVSQAGSGGTSTSTSNVYIGQVGSGGTQDWFDGKIDDVRIYNSSLTANQVKLLYNQGSASFGVLGDSEASDLTDGAGNPPIAHWNMDEGFWNNDCSTDTVFDISGNENHGDACPNTTGPTGNARGRYGNAGYFDGSDDYIDVAYTSSLDSAAPISFDFWINSTSDTGQAIWADTIGSTANDFFIIYVGGDISGSLTNELITIGRKDNGGTTDALAYTNATRTEVLDGNWHHISVVSDDTSWKIYLDGEEKPVTVGTGSNDGDYGIGGNTLRIANRRVSGSNSTHLSGLLDNFRVYNYARTQSQVAYDYNRGKPIGHWKLDECQGVTAYDSGSGGNNGTIIPGGAPNTSAGTCSSGAGNEMWDNGTTGKRNASLDFDGTNDDVNISDNSIFNISENITVSSWIKTDSTSDANFIVKKYRTTGSNREWSLRLNLQKIEVNFGDPADGSFEGTIQTDDDVVTNTSDWYHVTLAFSSGTPTIYVNGVSKPYSITSGAIPNTLYNGSADIDIGSDPENPANTFDGQIDDVRIYNYSLSETQIRKIMNESAVRFGPVEGSP